MTESDPLPTKAEDQAEAAQVPGPRAFATATGAVFQVFGSIFAFGSCCILSISGLVFAPASEPAAQWFSYLSGDRFETAMATLQIVASLVGGLGLAAAGIGMQSERPRSGGVGMWASGLLMLGCVAAIAARLIHGSPLPGLIAPLVVGVVTTGLFLLAGHSRQILRRFPPPEDQYVVDDEFLDEYRRRHRHH